MIDPDLAKKMDEILNGDKDQKFVNCTPPSEISKDIREQLSKFSTSMLCIIHAFTTDELYERGIEIIDDEKRDED
jgi:hypothetical protein